MGEIKITDLVPQETIESVKTLNAEMLAALNTYTSMAKELAKGIDIQVKGLDDIERLNSLLSQKSKDAAAATEQLSRAVAEQREAVANTTPVISRNLMEMERVNKSQREAYTEHDRVKKLLDQYHDTYENQVASLVKVTRQLDDNKKSQKELERALNTGRITSQQYAQAQAGLVAQHRQLTQEKRQLNQIMVAEEKAAMAPETSYKRMSQQLELLKNAYKELSEEGRSSDFGKELEATIQNLDAHLKETAASMGEFQRNVGNYAIAGQNGVVTTESLIAAMNQQAVTQQDLVDQTKILEEGKMMLNKEDEHYYETLDALNARLDENRRKLTDVSDIMGKEATSVAEAEAQNKRLAEALKHIDLTSDGAKKKLEEIRGQIQRNNETIAQATGANEKFADSMLSMIGVNTSFGSSLMGIESRGSFIDGMRDKISSLGKTLMGLLANPWVLTFLGITGVVAGFKWWYDYNKGLIEASRLTENFTGATGDAADKVTADMQTLADKMGKGYDETIGAANTMVQQFGISWDEAYEKMKDGIAAGADMSGNMLANIDRFAPALRDAGVSADEFMAILAETRNGIFNEDGIQNMLKAGSRLRSMTKQTEKSLNDVGISAKQMQEDLASGNITMIEAVQQVSAKLKELPENSQEAGNLMKNVFGRTAAQGGALLIQSIADINTNLEKAKENMGELGKVNEEQMNAQRELNGLLMSVFKASGTSFERMTTKAKTFVIQGLTQIIRGCMDIVNWFIRLYNHAVILRVAVFAIVAVFKSLWAISKNLFDLLLAGFTSLGGVIEGIMLVFRGNLEKGMSRILDSVADGLKDVKKAVQKSGKEIGEAFVDELGKAAENSIDELSIGLPDTDVDGPDHDPSNGDTPDPIQSEEEEEKAAKEAEKAAKEELKRLQALEESKIAMMEEGHEKELAMIRAKFKKKLEEMTGEGETEKALRVQLAEECEKEIAACELKYRTELAKTNLENRLATVKKGSREELDLRLAQMEAQREEELKEAKRKGADLLLVEEKYNQKRAELEEGYNAKRAQDVQKRYADEQKDRDNAMMSEISSLTSKYAEHIEKSGVSEERRAELKEKYEARSSEISEKYAIQTAKASVEMYEEILSIEGLGADEREKTERDLAAAKAELEKAVADSAIAQNERVKKSDDELRDKRIENAQRWLQVASDSLGAINDLVSTVFDAKIAKIEEEQEANAEAGEAEQTRITELVEKKVITEEEGEARKRAAEAQTAKKNEELEKKKAALQHKQAVYQKATDLAQAGISTALAITKALPNLVLAAIAGAMGAAQIATIAATPIPKYAKGTDFHPGGPAIVGDGGKAEVIVYRGEAWLSPDRPTLVDMPRGAAVIPNAVEFDGGPAAGARPLALPMPQGPKPAPGYDDKNIRRSVSELAQLIRTQTKTQHADSLLSKYELFKLRI